MFLHLGNDISVRTKDIWAIYDYAIFEGGVNKDALCRAAEKKKIIYTAGDASKNKSLIVTENALYVSAISSMTLKKRAEAGIYTEREIGE